MVMWMHLAVLPVGEAHLEVPIPGDTVLMLHRRIPGSATGQDTRNTPSKSTFTLGSGPPNLGLDCMLIFEVHFWEKPFLS